MEYFPSLTLEENQSEKGGYYRKHTHLHEKEGGPKSLRKGTVMGVNAPEFVHFHTKSLDINVNASTLRS